MNHALVRCIGIAVTLAIVQAPSSSGEDDQIALRNIFERARKISNMKAPGRAGFRLSGEIRIWMKKDTASQGKYLFISTPEGRWKEDIEFEGYKRVRSGDGKQFWQMRTSDVENEHIIEVDTLLGLGRLFMFRIEDKDKLKRLPAANIGGIGADCISHISAPGYARTFCFNSISGELVRYTPQDNSSDLPWKLVWED
jgi:hypothetical protein